MPVVTSRPSSAIAADPVPVAAEIVLALQAMVTRQFDVFDPVVVTVGKIAAGTTNNVIPATAVLEATVRSFSEATHAVVPERLTRVVDGIAAAHGLTATVDYQRGYPCHVEHVRRGGPLCPAWSAGMFGEQAYLSAPQPLSGAEDFSYVLQEVPGTYFGLGATPPRRGPRDRRLQPLRAGSGSPRSRSPWGPAVLAALAMDRLADAG